MKLKFLSALVLSMLCAPAVFAMSNDSAGSESEYRVPVYEGIEFMAEFDEEEGVVAMEWTPFEGRNDEVFMYYKVMKSHHEPNPVYPEDPAMVAMDSVSDLRFVDEWPDKSAYYRVCTITDKKGRYCSNVVWVEVPNGFIDNRERYMDQKEDREAYCENYSASGECEDDWSEEEKHKMIQEDEKHHQMMKEKMMHEKEMMHKKMEEKKKMMQERMEDKHEKMMSHKHDISDDRMAAVMEKVEPKLNAFLERLKGRLDNAKMEVQGKIKVIEKIQERLYGWEQGNELKTFIVDYLDRHLNMWKEEYRSGDLGDIDGFLNDLLES